MLTPKMIPRLPIDSCEALFEKLKWDFQQLEKDWTSPYTTFNFVVTAYHLYQDWIKRAGSHEQSYVVRNYQRLVSYFLIFGVI